MAKAGKELSKHWLTKIDHIILQCWLINSRQVTLAVLNKGSELHVMLSLTYTDERGHHQCPVLLEEAQNFLLSVFVKRYLK